MIFVETIGEVRKFRMTRSILGRAVYFTAAYWVDGLMIDTGCSYTVKELVSSLGRLPVHQIVNTHSHEDHIGANAAIARRYRARILAHPSALPILASPRKQKPLKPYQWVMWGYPEPSKAEAIPDTIQTDRHRFHVLYTPGHSLDHICFHEPDEGWLFCGDTYVGGQDKALRADYNVWQIIDSLKKLAELDINLLFTGSGTVRANAGAALSEKIRYLENKAEKAMELHHRGMSYGEITRRMFGREMLIAYVTLGHFSGRNLIRSFVEDVPTAR